MLVEAPGLGEYPIFIQVHEQDVECWVTFFVQFGMMATIDERADARDGEGAVYFVFHPTRDGIDREWVDGNPVIPLDDAVNQMMEHRAACEPALEIIAGVIQ